MQFYRTCKLAVWALRRNILRAALTTLGIVIGIAAVIAMMEIGGGSSRSIERILRMNSMARSRLRAASFSRRPIPTPWSKGAAEPALAQLWHLTSGQSDG